MTSNYPIKTTKRGVTVTVTPQNLICSKQRKTMLPFDESIVNYLRIIHIPRVDPLRLIYPFSLRDFKLRCTVLSGIFVFLTN